MKKEYRQSKKYGRMVRKLPTILKHEEQFRRELSGRRMGDSRTSLQSSRRGSLGGDSREVGSIEKELVAHKGKTPEQ